LSHNLITILPGHCLSAVVRRRSSSAGFCRLNDLCRQVDGPAATFETDVSRLPAQGCGTAFQLVLPSKANGHLLWTV